MERSIAVAEVETDNDRGKSLVLTAGMTSVTIGRSRDCDFVVDDQYVSRSHCRLQIEPSQTASENREQNRFILIDFGSTAGTIVNGKRVDRAELQHGDYFQIGSVRFRFRVVSEGAV
jgi:pSer/pThr/pTyr-binding forkhead associated (FHA) protein